MTLTEFLRTRFDEDAEQAAKAVGRGLNWPGLADGVAAQDVEAGWHVLRWNPDRVLAEREAKRRIVEEHRPDRGAVLCGCCWLEDLGTWEPYPCPTTKALALPYADHPDWRDEWRP